MRRLAVVYEGQRYGFGPFVGYYFRPADLKDLTRLEFLCFNERGFYASDVPENALLFAGEAVLRQLPGIQQGYGSGEERIRPVSFAEAPADWLATRPAPQEEFIHFHSCYDARGPTLLGYWLRHEAQSEFTYDMGARIHSGSVLYHPVVAGPDRNFARLIEFDAGPGNLP